MIDDDRHCAFCRESRTGALSDTILSDLIGININRIVYFDNVCFIVPSLGPLGRVHVLLVSHLHIHSLRDADAETRKHLYFIAAKAAAFILNRHQLRLFFFENGSRADSVSDEKCIDHLHLHIVTCPGLPDIADPQGPERQRVLPFLEICSDQIPESHDYIAFGFELEALSIRHAPVIETQFIRKALARSIGLPKEWNWRDYPRIAEVAASVSELRGPLDSFLRTRVQTHNQ